MTASSSSSGAFLAALLVCLASAASGQVRIVQTNSQGDNISLIDPATNQSSRKSKASRSTTARPRHLTAAACTSAARPSRRFDVVDGATLQLTKKIALCGPAQ